MTTAICASASVNRCAGSSETFGWANADSDRTPAGAWLPEFVSRWQSVHCAAKVAWLAVPYSGKIAWSAPETNRSYHRNKEMIPSTFAL